jgi:DNA sulfur modification protein DndD
MSNFGVYRGQHELITEPPTSVSGLPITLIGGLNGSGKTSIRRAVLLALYGIRSPDVVSKRKYKEYLRQWINRDASPDEETWVELELSLRASAEDISLRVRRMWKYRNSDTEEFLSVWKNGTRDDFISGTWDQYIDEVLPVGLAGLFFFDGEKISDIAESEETPENVQDAIRVLLGLSYIDRAISDLDSVIRKYRRRLRDSGSRARLEELAREKEALQRQIDDTIQKIAGNRTRLAFLNSQIESVEDSLLGSGRLITQERIEFEEDLDAVDQALTNVRAGLIDLCSGELPLLLVRTQLESLLHSALRQEEGRQARTALGILKERNRELLEWLKPRAPEDVMQAMVCFLRHQEEQLERVANQADYLPISSTGVIQLRNLLYHEFDQAASQALAIRSEQEDLEDRRRLLLWNLTRPVDESANKDLERLKELSAQKGSCKQQYEQLTHLLGSLQAAIKQLEKREIGIADELIGADEAERIIGTALKSQESLREFRKRLAQLKSSTLISYISEAFDSLTHKQTLVSSIELDPELLHLHLRDSKGDQIPKSTLSTGERQMLAVSVLWGLARASGRQLPVLIDSPVGRLDSSHRLNFVREFFPNAGKQVILLSTDTEIVGPYLCCLQPYIARTYLLNYDEQSGETTITSSYFSDKEAEISP